MVLYLHADGCHEAAPDAANNGMWKYLCCHKRDNAHIFACKYELPVWNNAAHSDVVSKEANALPSPVTCIFPLAGFGFGTGPMEMELIVSVGLCAVYLHSGIMGCAVGCSPSYATCCEASCIEHLGDGKGMPFTITIQLG